MSFTHPTFAALLAAVAFHAAAPGTHTVMHLFVHLGLIGLLLISLVDSSFVPLPIPGVTDILVILYAANHTNVFLLVAITTAGSALGGLFSHAVGQTGGKQFLERYISPATLHRITHWMEEHTILSVALPAVLPPPMPLTPFVLAAGAAHMSRKRFLTVFTLSRFARHAFAAWLGVHYGRAVLGIWNRFSAKWGTTALVVFWSITLASTAFGIYKLIQTSREMKLRASQPLHPAEFPDALVPRRKAQG